MFAVGPEMESCFEKTSKLGPQMANSRIRGESLHNVPLTQVYGHFNASSDSKLSGK